MKFLNLVMGFSLIVAVVASGCGGNQQSSTPVGAGIPGVGLPGVTSPVVPAGIAGATVPVGCYYTGITNCSPCPTGYTQNGTYCQMTQGYNGAGCMGGSIWNGYACSPNGYSGCPGNLAYSSQYYGACLGLGNQMSQYQNYQCYPVYNGYGGYTQRCYYTYGAPMNGYYYNGFGWYRSSF